jgi:DNA-binding NarL/FixJ family response regulator
MRRKVNWTRSAAPEPEVASLTAFVVGAWPALSNSGILEIGNQVLARCPQDAQALRQVTLRLHPAWLVLADAPDLALCSLIALARQIHPGVRFAVLGPLDDFERCQRWLRRGASVYLQNTSSPYRLVKAMETAGGLHVIVTDEAFYSLARAREAELRTMAIVAPLTRREHEVLELVRAGFRNSAIASAMTVTESTVEFHVSHLLDKLGVSNRTEAVSRANLLGL